MAKNFSVRGDIGVVYDTVKKVLTGLKFTEVASTWPKSIELKRGKSGLLARNMLDCKTNLKVSLTQVIDNVEILFDYTFGIPASYLEANNLEIEREFLNIKHAILDGATLGTITAGKVCDICLSPIKKGDMFCSNCGRSAKRGEVEGAHTAAPSLDVTFDSSRVPFGQKMLDDLLCGGIPNFSAVVMTSPASEEKDLIVTRFLETGIDQSESTVYLSSRLLMSGSNNIKNENLFQVICNSQADLMIPQDVKNIVKVKGVENLTELSLALTSLLNNIPFKQNSSKPRRFVFDILSDMLLSTQSVNTRKWLRETVTKFKAKNFTTLGLLNPYMHSKEEVHALLDIFDGQIDLFEKEKEGTPAIFMRVKRMNNAKYSSKEVELIRENLSIQKTK